MTGQISIMQKGLLKVSLVKCLSGAGAEKLLAKALI